MGAAEEELLVAMAMSRSLHEEEEAKARLLASGRQNGARQGRKSRRGEKKSRAMPPRSPPTLLLQDPEEARRRTEERVAWLLSEADEFPSTPPLPPSRLLALSELSRKADWPVALPKGGPSSLWERSALVGLSAPGPVCVAGSTLPALPWQAVQGPTRSTALPMLGSVRPEAEEMLLQEGGCGRDLQGKSPREERGEEAAAEAEGHSRKEEEALQDLVELAGEGLTLTQWAPAAQRAEAAGQEGVPGDAPRRRSLSPSLEQELPPPGSRSPPFLLGLLATAFKGMVNNPHLSDVQFQVDSGELFYAHMFVLYARCPQLMEVVDQKGFWVAEEGGEVKTRRVLLSDVSGEAAGVFLNYLYTAEHFVPPRVLSDVAALAVRFGVAELAALCTSPGWSERPAGGGAPAGDEEEERGGKFEELLKSIWAGEEEGDKAVLLEEPGIEEVVEEPELEEIYEFAATQRKAEEKEERRSRERIGVAEVGAPPMEEGAVPADASEEAGSLALEPPQREGRDARKEAGPSFPLEPLRDATEQRPLGAAGGRHLAEALPGLAEASREGGERSFLDVSWGESLELFQQSCSGREPSDGAAAEGVAAIQSSTPLGWEEGLLPLSRTFSSSGSQVLLGGVLADQLPASPKRRGGFGSGLSPPLFPPAPQEARGRPRHIEEQQLPELQRAASAGTAAGGGADSLRCAPAALPSPPSPVDLEGPPVLMAGPEDERQLGLDAMGSPSGERAMNGPLSRQADVSCCQGRGAPLLGVRPGGERIRVPGSALLSCRGPNGGQVAKLGLASGPEAQRPGEAQDSRPTQKSAVIPSPKRPALQGWRPLGPCSPSPRSSTCLPRDGKSVADVVMILDDSEEEAEAAAQLSWGSSVLEADLPLSEDDGARLSHVAGPEKGSVAAQAGSCQLDSPPGPLLVRNGPPPGGSRTAGNDPLPCRGGAEEGSCSGDGSRRRRLDFRGQGDEMEILPLTQQLPSPVTTPDVPTTPDLVRQERDAPCTTPPTPMPSYSIMETPVLKKELSRFGVRTLPKQQMVLKLKEIFQYTHQRSDSGDAAASSQPGLCRRTQAARRRPALAAAHSGFPNQPPGCPELLQVLLAGAPSGAGDQGQAATQGCWPAGSGRRKRAAGGPVRGVRALTASRKADGLSGAASDASVILQSSSTELETSVLAEEEEEAIPASQSACREADMLAALRQYIHSSPALRRQILFYQPFELAGLQSELKQNGIRIALGRLLEFLDAHGITFTTAEARREKQQQRGPQGRGRRKRC